MAFGTGHHFWRDLSIQFSVSQIDDVHTSQKLVTGCDSAFYQQFHQCDQSEHGIVELALRIFQMPL